MAKAVKLETLVSRLNRSLDIELFSDNSHNGLQVANRSGLVTKICAGVDATLPFFKAAVEQGADLAIVHHGISWGDSLKRITGLNFEIVSFLLEHNLALWACHLPLDAHLKFGNNAQIASTLGLRKIKPFGAYHGQKIGVQGELASALSFKEVHDLIGKKINSELQAFNLGPERIKRMGIVSGGGSDALPEAIEAKLDLFLTGEPVLWAYNLALQEGINLAFAGHYATEVFGVKALLPLVRQWYRLPVNFIDTKIPL